MLEALTLHAQQASGALNTLIETDPAGDNNAQQKVEQCAQEIKAAKTAAKKVLANLTEEVCRTFITPFDREDLQELANSIYLIPKLISKIYSRMVLNQLWVSHDDFHRFSVIIVRQSEALNELMKGLSRGLQPNVIQQKAAVLYELEDQSDETLGQLMADLFKHTDDPRQWLLRKDLYEMLEDVTDHYRDAAAVGLRIVLKHS